MSHPEPSRYRVSEAAEVLAVSDDTVRRWIDQGRLEATQVAGRTTVAGVDLAALAEVLAGEPDVDGRRTSSARNRLHGIVVAIKKDTVMAQVELICGPNRIVSLMSAEAADELGLVPGARAVASVKATNVVVERA